MLHVCSGFVSLQDQCADLQARLTTAHEQLAAATLDKQVAECERDHIQKKTTELEKRGNHLEELVAELRKSVDEQRAVVMKQQTEMGVAGHKLKQKHWLLQQVMGLGMGWLPVPAQRSTC